MATDLGKVLKKIRVDNNEILLDMAQKLEVSPAFLSKVENGLKKPPAEWEQKLIQQYDLSELQKDEISKYMFEAINNKSIDISSYSCTEKNVMMAFARNINALGEEKLKAIQNIIDDN